MTYSQEVEMKLPIGADALERLLQAVEQRLGYQVQKRGTLSQHDCYYDTDDWWFWRAGIAMRSRQLPDRTLLTVKTLTPPVEGIARRTEIEEVVQGGPPFDRVPKGSIRDLLKSCGAPLRLRPLFNIRTERQSFGCVTEDHQIELTADQAAVLKPPGRKGPPLDTFHEIELESRNGQNPEHMSRLRDVLSKEFAVYATEESKFERGLRTTGIEPPSIAPVQFAHSGDRLVETAYRVLEHHMRQMLANEPGTRLGLDAEFLHDMRVAARRMRAACKAFALALPPSRTRFFERELRWLGDVLGEVRDLDVYILNFPIYTRDIPPHEAARLAAYEEELRRRREDARARMMVALNSARYERLQERLRRWLEKGAPSRPSAPLANVPTPEGAGVTLRRAFDRVMKRGKKASKETTTERLHSLRIACKQLRYTCEWLVDLYEDRVAEFTRRVTKLQGLLGTHHDASVAAWRLAHSADDFASAEEVDGGSLMLLALGQMIAAQRRTMREAEEAFPSAWRKFARAKVAKKLLWAPVNELYWSDRAGH